MTGGSVFERQLEYHKIPEFYDEYFNYHLFKSHMKNIQKRKLSINQLNLTYDS